MDKLFELADAFLARARDEPFLTLSEGLAKVRCIEAALSLGWTIQEGAGHSPNGPVADFATMTAGKVVWTRGPRRLQLADGSADFTIVNPFELMLEIKTRPDFGTKAQAQFEQMYFDVQQAARDPRCAFMFLFDPLIYRSFSGAKIEGRGRPANSNRLMSCRTLTFAAV